MSLESETSLSAGDKDSSVQTDLALPGTSHAQDESGRESPSKMPQLAQRVEQEQVKDTADQPGPFNTLVEKPQATSVQLESPSAAVTQEDQAIQETVAGLGLQDSNISPLGLQMQDSVLLSLGNFDPLDNLSCALRDLLSVEKVLRYRKQDNTASLARLESTQKDLEVCQQEREEYILKYDTLVETHKTTKTYYQHKLGALEREMVALRDESERQHEEDKANLRHSEKQTRKLNKKYKRQSSELQNVESRYKAKQAEVERLRERLQQKEKELKETEEELMAKKAEVRELGRETQVGLIQQERETTKEQLERCQQIDELVRKLPQGKTEEDREVITKQIYDEIEHMRALTNKRFMSWQ